MRIKILTFLVFLTISPLAFADQVDRNLNDQPWTLCKGANCVGKANQITGVQTIIAQDPKQAPYTQDLKTSVFHADALPDKAGDVLWFLPVTDMTKPVLTWVMDYYVYIVNIQGSEGVEIDGNNGLGVFDGQNMRLVYGTTCGLNPRAGVGGNDWAIFNWFPSQGAANAGYGKWLDTGVPCSFTEKKWYHVVAAFSSDPANKTGMFNSIIVSDAAPNQQDMNTQCFINPNSTLPLPKGCTTNNMRYTYPLSAINAEPIPGTHVGQNIDFELNAHADSGVPSKDASYDVYINSFTLRRGE